LETIIEDDENSSGIVGNKMNDDGEFELDILVVGFVCQFYRV